MIASTSYLRRVLAADAVASGATGLLLAFGGDLLQGLTGLQAEFNRPAGFFLIAYAAAVAWVASRAVVHGGLVWAIIGINLVWSAESIVMLVTGFLQPTALGYAFVVAQAVVVAAFAQLEFMGLRRSERVAG